MENLKILTDKEIKDLQDDSIDFSCFAKTLKRIIATAETPITIGIYGNWGAGKTSLMRLTQKLLENDAQTVWFNAWKYDSVYDLRVALIRNILKEMESNQKICEKVRELSKRINWLAIPKVLTSISLGPIPIDLQEIIKQEDVISLISEFDERFNELVKEFAKGKKLIVFIDDLDRCLPDKTLDILEAIKLFLDAPDCVFILGLNKILLDEAIKLKYKDIHLESTDYLEKIINLSFNMPELRENDVKDFIMKLAPQKIRDYSMIMAKIGGNPRRIKRTINKCVLQMILAEESPQLNVEKDILAKLAVLELKWDKFYVMLINSYDPKSNNSILKELEMFDKIDSSEKEKIISQYYIDEELIEFLCDHPTLWKIKLEPYIFLRSTSAINDEIFSGSDLEVNKKWLFMHSIGKLKSNDMEKKIIGLAEIYHGWIEGGNIDNTEMLRELIESYNAESNITIKEQILNIIGKIK